MLYTFAVLLSLAMTTRAEASCPTANATNGCNGGGSTDICTQDGSGNITCSLEGGGGTATATDFQAGTNLGGDFEAWGDDRAGEAFCCVFSYTCGITVTIDGTPVADTIDLNDDLASLSCTTSTVNGHAGTDTINGSNDATNVDMLYGDGDADLINGWSGNDTIYGGDETSPAGDTLSGGPGDDIIYGGLGDNDEWGGNGIDYIYGGTGVDKMRGDANDDVLSGGGGGDTICGGPGVDDLTGGPGLNHLFGGWQHDYMRDLVDGDDTCSDNADTVVGCASPTTNDTCPL